MKTGHLALVSAFLLVILLSALNLGSASPADWPMYRNNSQHTGVASDSISPPLTLKWSQKFNLDIDNSPAVSGSHIYVGSNDYYLYALDTTTGAIQWSFNDGGNARQWQSSPAIASVGGQTVIFAGNNNTLFYAVRSDGTKLWSYTTAGNVTSSPVVTTIGGTQVVIFGSDDGTASGLPGKGPGGLYALVAATGALYPGWPTNPFRPTVTTSFATSPAISSQTVLVGGTDGRLYGVNLGNGIQLWNYTISGNYPIYSSPAVYGSWVFFGSDDNKTRAVLTSNGALVWQFPVGGHVRSSPAVATVPNPTSCGPGPTPAVIFGSDDGNLYGVRASDAIPCWTQFHSPGAKPFRTSPTVSNQTIYVGSDDGNFYAVDLNHGTWQWSYPAFDAIGDALTSPNVAVSGTRLYVGSQTGYLYAFEQAAPVVTTVTTTVTGGSVTSTATITVTSTVTAPVTSTVTTTVTGTAANATVTVTRTTTSITLVCPSGPVPGFPVESVVVGLASAYLALFLIRKRRKCSHT